MDGDLYSDIPNLDVEWDDTLDLVSNRRRPSEGLAQDDCAPLHSTTETPRVRERLHSMCALYAYAPNTEQRLLLLDQLEEMTFELARVLAFDILQSGWSPDPDFDRAALLRGLARAILTRHSRPNGAAIRPATEAA